MIKVLELKGIKSLGAMNVFHTLMLGLKMLPAYAGESYEDFYERAAAMDPKDQESLIREAVLFVPLDATDVQIVISFCADANGIPYGPENLKNLGPKELMECIVAVCMRVAAIKVDMVSPGEKKKSADSQLT